MQLAEQKTTPTFRRRTHRRVPLKNSTPLFYSGCHQPLTRDDLVDEWFAWSNPNGATVMTVNYLGHLIDGNTTLLEVLDEHHTD